MWKKCMYSQITGFSVTNGLESRNLCIIPADGSQWGIKICLFRFHIYSEKVTKFCKISTLLLFNGVPVKIKVEISQNFWAFSEYINFTEHYQSSHWSDNKGPDHLGVWPWILLCFLVHYNHFHRVPQPP